MELGELNASNLNEILSEGRSLVSEEPDGFITCWQFVQYLDDYTSNDYYRVFPGKLYNVILLFHCNIQAISTSAEISNDSDFNEYCYVKYVEKMTEFIIREIKKGVADSQMYDCSM